LNCFAFLKITVEKFDRNGGRESTTRTATFVNFDELTKIDDDFSRGVGLMGVDEFLRKLECGSETECLGKEKGKTGVKEKTERGGRGGVKEWKKGTGNLGMKKVEGIGGGGWRKGKKRRASEGGKGQSSEREIPHLMTRYRTFVGNINVQRR
jgi:hypothetical protein